MGAVGARGVDYWESNDRSDRRLLYINNGYLTAIDARTGKIVDSFGDNGRTDLRTGLDRDAPRALQTSNPGRVFENLMIVPLPAGGASYDSNAADIHAYDTRTGKLGMAVSHRSASRRGWLRDVACGCMEDRRRRPQLERDDRGSETRHRVYSAGHSALRFLRSES
jgi:glucose dehydrogenase